MTKAVLVAAVSAAAVLTVAACSSSGSGSSDAGSHSGMSMSTAPTQSSGASASGPHNSVDIEFATMMIPHHQQAVEMAELALTKSTDAEVKRFATQIKAAQGPEIKTMSSWLASWGSPVPPASTGPSMRGMSMPGEMSDADMTSLKNATGASFDRMWLEMMIKHHEGAIDMAKTELTDGQFARGKALAQAIIAGQSAEISQFRKLLDS